MNREQLEHIIRAAAATANVRDIVVIGSQSILGTYPDAPKDLTESMEADVFPRDDPPRSIVIDGAIGELSLFHQTFKYYGHGVDDSTAILPDGWRTRLVKVETAATMGAVGWCLEVHDLAISKLLAAREKDLSFVGAMLREKMVAFPTLQARLQDTSKISPDAMNLALSRLQRLQTP